MFIAALLFIFFSSCTNEVKNKEQETGNSTTPAGTQQTGSKPQTTNEKPQTVTDTTASRVPIGKTDFTIALPATYKIDEQQGTDFVVYYFTPVDTTQHKGEGGIYFGQHPDISPPSTNYVKQQVRDVFLGDSLNWTEYVTVKYIQRETFIDQPGGQKIHVWCYAGNFPELEKMFSIIKTISR